MQQNNFFREDGDNLNQITKIVSKVTKRKNKLGTLKLVKNKNAYEKHD